MENQRKKISRYVGTILNVTKNTIKKNQNFYDYYVNKDISLYQRQLPILIQKANMQSIAIKKKEKSNNIHHKLFEETTKSISVDSLNNIRISQERSKKLPPLCPFYNKKGELLRSVVASTKINNKHFLFDSSSSYRISSPNNLAINRGIAHNKIKNIIIKNNIIINFDDFQKDFFNDPKYSSMVYEDSQIFGKKDYYYQYIKNKIEDFKKSEIIKNNEFKKEKNFDKSANKKSILLSINSLAVKIYEIPNDLIDNNETEIETKKNDNPIYTYNLPFEYLPLFYYKGEEKFKIILAQIIQYDNKGDRFILNENFEKKIKDILKYTSDFNENLRNNINRKDSKALKK